MSKRANPFTEDFIPQSKIHVGLKQFNNNEDRLKKVYEKTLELLFKGAKKCSTQDEVSNATDDIPRKKDKMTQLFLEKDGTLSHDKNIKIVDKQLLEVRCGCGNVSVDVECAYCEAALCLVCQHTCSQCLRGYCSHCSLTESEGSEKCMSCYG
ncbi:uncharacterized protein LOC126381962 [Pectinophora gossypiella]|uniref:uncharacterized protein LOC126381962 n=1 Tax=Pectinophora gossypiella TaxID=13191 RepID=UPI00214E7643|nr:uncharacterized protein LOC126381962 [Pectinophora gossypiella]